MVALSRTCAPARVSDAWQPVRAVAARSLLRLTAVGLVREAGKILKASKRSAAPQATATFPIARGLWRSGRAKARLRDDKDRKDSHGLAEVRRNNAFRPPWAEAKEARQGGAMLTARRTSHAQRIGTGPVVRGVRRCDGIALPPW